MNVKLKLDYKGFKAVIIKMLEQALWNSLETNEKKKTENLIKEIKVTKKKWNHRTKRYNNRNKHLLDGRWQRLESVNLKTDQ